MVATNEKLTVLLVGDSGDEAVLLERKAASRTSLRIESLPGDAAASQPSLASAGVIILHRVRWSAEYLRAATRCRAILHLGADAGCDLEEARELGIFVCSVAGTSAEEVAEHIVPILQEYLVTGKPAYPLSGHRDFRRPRLGLIGLGRLGRAIAGIARARKFDLWAFDPFALEEDFIQAGARPTPRLEDALGIPDLVFVQVAPAESNRHMISDREIETMRKGAWLINVGWGGAVDTAAVQAALRTGHLSHFIPDSARTGHSLSEQLEAAEETVSESGLVAAFDLAARIARGEDPTPLLIDPPCPRWEP